MTPGPGQLPPGAYFPMEPTPVRDGLPLWAVDVRVLSDEDLLGTWQDADQLSHPQLDGVRGYGFGDLPDRDDEVYSTHLRIWAADEAEARAIADALVDELSGGRGGLRRLEVEPAFADEYFELPRAPEDYESRLAKTGWHRCEPSDAGVKIAWFTGPCPLERVDVDESLERVTITLWERYPPRFAAGGIHVGISAVGFIRCVDVPLQAPLGSREAIDGKTGRPPDAIDVFDFEERSMREMVMGFDLDTLECVPMP